MELIVAMVILVILLPSAIPLYERFLADAKEEALRQRLNEVRRAITAFRMEHGRYPNRLFDSFGNNVDFLDNDKSELVQGVHDGPGTYPLNRRTFLPEIPEDPFSEQLDWDLVIMQNENIAERQSSSGLRITTERSRRVGWSLNSSTNKWVAPPAVVNPYVPRAVSGSGIGDVRSRTSGYEEL